MALFQSLEKIYDLYLSLLLLALEINKTARLYLEKSKTKHLSTFEDLNPKTLFIDNRIISTLAKNKRFNKHLEQKKIQWSSEFDFPGKIFREIRQWKDYQEYLSGNENGFEKDKKIWIDIYKNFILHSEELHLHFEEKNIHWEDDITLAGLSVIKTLELLKPETSEEESILIPLYKDEAEDAEFARELFRKTILSESEFSKMISEKAANWELDRIAVADMILMKMALCELLRFENIPIKVSLNEYIELSKEYSTPQSKTFINGILDKIVIDLKSSGKIIKKGRGLIGFMF